MNQREMFLKHVAQTSPSPLALEIVKAEGALLWDAGHNEFIDLIGGINVANIGHRNPMVLAAIRAQLDAYLHIMVYGEFIETPQVQYAKMLTDYLPGTLNSVYFTNSGAEAVDGAMKLAKRVTNRSQIIAFNKSYHGSTQGALSIIGDEYWRNAFRPLLPGIIHEKYNSTEAINLISEETACVVVEAIQGEAGIIPAHKDWLRALESKCRQSGAMLVVDEIQTGFGRTGKLWAFQHFEIVPDILLLGKALGGGMPLGAFVASEKLMNAFTENPVLGHITTFGGHPVCCAAGMAAMKVLLGDDLANSSLRKLPLFEHILTHPGLLEVRNFGLWLALEFESFEVNKKIIDFCINNGVLTDWFLFAPNCLRIAPPLNITDSQIERSCRVLKRAFDTVL